MVPPLRLRPHPQALSLGTRPAPHGQVLLPSTSRRVCSSRGQRPSTRCLDRAWHTVDPHRISTRVNESLLCTRPSSQSEPEARMMVWWVMEAGRATNDRGRMEVRRAMTMESTETDEHEMDPGDQKGRRRPADRWAWKPQVKVGHPSAPPARRVGHQPSQGGTREALSRARPAFLCAAPMTEFFRTPYFPWPCLLSFKLLFCLFGFVLFWFC